MTAPLTVVSPGVLTTVQDAGRLGFAHLGVPVSGAADVRSLEAANLLVGNPAHTPALECLGGGLEMLVSERTVLAVAGASVVVHVGGVPAPFGRPFAAAPGQRVSLSAVRSGARVYLAVAGGVAVETVLGSSATDTLSGLGPPPLHAGDQIGIGSGDGSVVGRREAIPPRAPVTSLRVEPGPRGDWFAPDALARLASHDYEVSPDSNRVGVRLVGTPIHPVVDDQLPSEGMVRGAVQIPPSGQPIVFGPDHPTTGGYPVLAVLVDPDEVGQLLPGARIGFVLV